VTYPRPRVPPRPILSFRRRDRARDVLPSVLDSGASTMLTSGRVALATALIDMNVKAGDTILIPAFNCTSMLAPVVWCGARIVLFKVHADLSVDIEDLVSKVDSTTRAVLIVHYFGFPQSLRALRSFCDTRDIRLIEDCAHAYFGVFDGRPPGSVGDYAVASMMKFYPIYDGGCLVSSRRMLEPAAPGNWNFQVKSALNLLEESIRYGRLRPLNWVLGALFLLKDWIWSQTKKALPSDQVEGLGPEAADGGYGFNSKWINVSASWISRRVLASTSVATVIARRQRNYRRLAAALKDVPGCRPLFPELPDTVVPYVFPLLVDSPATVFPQLKNARVPLYRWETIERGVCPVSERYASHLLQVPCHQDLRDEELRWMTETIKATVLAALSQSGDGASMPRTRVVASGVN
jgi:perosamine synthetase